MKVKFNYYGDKKTRTVSGAKRREKRYNRRNAKLALR